jgi:hypothetical protein
MVVIINTSKSEGSLNNERVVMICDGWHSLALTESGRVFG